MTRRQLTVIASLVLCALILGASSLFAACTDTVHLKYAFKKGQVLRYQVTDTSELQASLDGEVLVSTTVFSGIAQLRVVNVNSDGSAELKVSYESATEKNETGSANMSAMSPVTLIVSGRGEIKDPLAARKAGRVTYNWNTQQGPCTTYGNAMEPLLTALGAKLPTTAVKKGATWTQPVFLATEREWQTTLIGTGLKEGKHTVSVFETKVDTSPGVGPDGLLIAGTKKVYLTPTGLPVRSETKIVDRTACMEDLFDEGSEQISTDTTSLVLLSVK